MPSNMESLPCSRPIRTWSSVGSNCSGSEVAERERRDVDVPSCPAVEALMHVEIAACRNPVRFSASLSMQRAQGVLTVRRLRGWTAVEIDPATWRPCMLD